MKLNDMMNEFFDAPRRASGLRKFATGLVGDRPEVDPDDLIHQAVVQTLRLGARVRATTQQELFKLLQVKTRFCFLDDLKRKRPAVGLDDAVEFEAPHQDAYDLGEVQRVVREQIQRLHPRDRDLVTMQYIEGVPPVEIQKRMRLSKHGYEKALWRCRVRLRVMMGEIPALTDFHAN